MTPKADNAQSHEKPHPKGKPPHKEPLSPEERKARRACNTPANATNAVTTGRGVIEKLQAGPVWTKCTPHGDYEIKGCLTYDGKPAVILHFSPEDGSLLPKGLHALTPGKPEVSEIVVEQLEAIATEVTILEGAEFREPEFCWVVPVAHKGRIVGHLKVSADGQELVFDKKAEQEIREKG